MLNEFFRVIVDTVNKHGGFVNKFQGDAALAILVPRSTTRTVPQRHSRPLVSCRAS